MSVKSLLSTNGGLATRKPIPRNVKWEGTDENGEPTSLDETLHFLDLSAEDAKLLLKERDGVDGDVQFIAGILCEPDGKPALTVDEARTLKLTLLSVLVKTGLEVIGLTKASKADAKKD